MGNDYQVSRRNFLKGIAAASMVGSLPANSPGKISDDPGVATVRRDYLTDLSNVVDTAITKYQNDVEEYYSDYTNHERRSAEESQRHILNIGPDMSLANRVQSICRDVKEHALLYSGDNGFNSMDFESFSGLYTFLSDVSDQLSRLTYDTDEKYGSSKSKVISILNTMSKIRINRIESGEWEPNILNMDLRKINSDDFSVRYDYLTKFKKAIHAIELDYACQVDEYYGKEGYSLEQRKKVEKQDRHRFHTTKDEELANQLDLAGRDIAYQVEAHLCGRSFEGITQEKFFAIYSALDELEVMMGNLYTHTNGLYGGSEDNPISSLFQKAKEVSESKVKSKEWSPESVRKRIHKDGSSDNVTKKYFRIASLNRQK